ncbi:Melamine deaminase [Providencia alcalifaciens]|nr:Melamine deaminase [Providencia alcalifaciens]
MTLLRSLVAMSMIAAPIAVLAATPADLMIVDGTILTMDAHNKVIENGTVVIDKNKIVAVGGPELTKQYTAKKQLNVDGDIVMPGLINTHTHASMTVFRSLADDVPDRLHATFFH